MRFKSCRSVLIQQSSPVSRSLFLLMFCDADPNDLPPLPQIKLAFAYIGALRSLSTVRTAQAEAVTGPGRTKGLTRRLRPAKRCVIATTACTRPSSRDSPLEQHHTINMIRNSAATNEQGALHIICSKNVWKTDVLNLTTWYHHRYVSSTSIASVIGDV